MSNQGARGFYQITETLKTQLLADENVNTVTTGDITEIDLSKQTIFPLSHIIINNVSIQEQVLQFNISVLAMDIVNKSKEATSDLFRGNNNEQDILNTQLAVVNKLIGILRQGTLYTTQYQLVSDGSVEFFYDRFENEMAGVVCTFDVFVANDIDLCD
tara:strand:+ start:1385 stop:1858 length:474 start_codon:yes stop_codon:yes gene_type:complete